MYMFAHFKWTFINFRLKNPLSLRLHKINDVDLVPFESVWDDYDFLVLFVSFHSLWMKINESKKLVMRFESWYMCASVKVNVCIENQPFRTSVTTCVTQRFDFPFSSLKLAVQRQYTERSLTFVSPYVYPLRLKCR